MKILFTSDWQVDYENISTCRKVVDEILALKERLGFHALVHCGDVKHSYNPIDVRVVNFVIKEIKRLREAGLEVHIGLGNHDRIGMHVDKQNWLPILRKAGAKAYDEPAVVEFENGRRRLFIQPFRNSSVLLRRELHDLAKDASPDDSVLIFHSDLSKARYNVLSRSECKDISIEDLLPKRYAVCIGGHIHFQHNVGRNVWYVGLPFATDWGEANQKKGYLLWDYESRTLKSLNSKIPGWYDPAWPGFEEARPASWKGTRIRIKVKVEDIRSVDERLQYETDIAHKSYPGAEIVCIPQFVERDTTSVGIRADYTDRKKIEIYTDKSLPRGLEKYREDISTYLLEQLDQAGGSVREGKELKFEKIWARNFLSFRKLNFTFTPGLTVVAGLNKDWRGRSNGSGKTSFLQPTAVALFGQTFKEQKADRWKRKGTKKGKKCFVGVQFRDALDRQAIVWRSRSPKKKLKLRVDGTLVDSGNTQTGKKRAEFTRRSIERITGYTWETLSNAIYIDQTRAHCMLTGTEAERKGFLAKLQNLERFERAKKQIGEQKKEQEASLNIAQMEIAGAITEIKNINQTISETKQILAPEGNPEEEYERAKKRYLEAKQELEAWEKQAEIDRDKRQDEIDKVQLEDDKLRMSFGSIEEKISAAEKTLKRLKKLEGICITCLQPIEKKHIHQQIPIIEKSIFAFKKSLETTEISREVLLERLGQLEEQQEGSLDNNELASKMILRRNKYEKLKMEKEQYEQLEVVLKKLRGRRSVAKEKLDTLAVQKYRLEKKLKILDYAEKVFARDGLPAYLNAQICPQLNQSAEEYAELFSQKEIQVRFAVDEEGRMDVKVVNAHGGEGVGDQSEGEMKIASLITSFAVRSIAPKTNLLILDEPGDGLDATSARQFAKGLKEITKRFGTILLTSHNPAILGELASETLVTVVKENGISRVIE